MSRLGAMWLHTLPCVRKCNHRSKFCNELSSHGTVSGQLKETMCMHRMQANESALCQCVRTGFPDCRS
eukprot:3467716-Amphidinium_carterae.2